MSWLVLECSGCSSLLDLVLVLDASGSVQRERMHYVREFAEEVVMKMDVGPTATRVGGVYFSDAAVVEFTLDQYTTKQDVIQGIRNIPYVGGRTNLADAQRKARTGVLEVCPLGQQNSG